MEDLSSILEKFLTAAFNLINGQPESGIHPNMVWVIVIGFFAIAISIAVNIDS